MGNYFSGGAKISSNIIIFSKPFHFVKYIGDGGVCNHPTNPSSFFMPCRDAMLRVFSTIGFNVNFTLNTWF